MSAVVRVSMVLLAVLATVVPAAVDARTFQTLYTFNGAADGANPNASLIRDDAGYLYGTTSAGGNVGEGCTTLFYGCGTVFRLAPSGTLTTLHTFVGGTDGANPMGALILHDGHLFGTTESGGRDNRGTVFKVARRPSVGYEEVLYSFHGGGEDGAYPYGALLRDRAGGFFGMTAAGGTANSGTIFHLSLIKSKPGEWTESISHSFGTGGDGANPYWGALVADHAGNLYGMTEIGGSADAGTVFELTSNGTEMVLHSFTGPDGLNPLGGLIEKSGNLYGATWFGSAAAGAICGGAFKGCGSVFQMNQNGRLTTLYTFTGRSDGASPEDTLIADRAGNLYGTTVEGGDLRGCAFRGCGTVFKLSRPADPQSPWTERVLHSFAGGADGSQPIGGLIIDNNGNLYGTTWGGYGSQGTIFKITP